MFEMLLLTTSTPVFCTLRYMSGYLLNVRIEGAHKPVRVSAPIAIIVHTICVYILCIFHMVSINLLELELEKMHTLRYTQH